LFNRGITNPGLFPFLEKLRGLRSVTPSEENLSALNGRQWDAIVDVWPYDPTVVESAARLLRDRTSHYLYVSSIAAYDAHGFARPGLTEDGALNPWDLSIRPYDRGKSESERRLRSILGEKLTIVRPGPIKGSRDDTPDLFAWCRRALAGGRHIGPGTGEEHIQHVDVKDVGRFLVQAIDHPLYGVFNLTGVPMTFREYVGDCATTLRSSAEWVWIPRAFLHEQGLDPAPFNSPTIPAYLGKFPGWHPEPERAGIFQISSAKAFGVGWTQRSRAETILDYLWSFDAMGSDLHWTDELAPDVEKRVLDLWAAGRR
jgi:2'-hydroxyisoflavone reductase